MKLKSAEKPMSKLSAKASVNILKELWPNTALRLNNLDEGEHIDLSSAAEEIGGLLDNEKLNDEKDERAWLLFQHITAELARYAAAKRIGEGTTSANVVQAANMTS